MNSIGRHPFSFLFAGAGIVLLLIAIAASTRTGTSAVGAPTVIANSPGALINPGIAAANPAPPQGSADPEPAPAVSTYVYAPPAPAASPARAMVPAPAASRSGAPGGGVGTAPSGANTPASVDSNALLNEVYSLIPTGISVPISAPKPRTADQQSLYIYGNEAGLAVLTFENEHADMAQVLKDWFDNRANPAKAVIVEQIANDLTATGKALAALPDVPPSAAPANAALAQAYQSAGEKLHAVGVASGNDTDLLAAIKQYDTTVDSFTASYIALVQLFSLYGVSFGGSDAGSAFQFPASSL